MYQDVSLQGILQDMMRSAVQSVVRDELAGLNATLRNYDDSHPYKMLVSLAKNVEKSLEDGRELNIRDLRRLLTLILIVEDDE